jgi:hypothetical protein
MIDWALDSIAKDLTWLLIAVGAIAAIAVVSLLKK